MEDLKRIKLEVNIKESDYISFGFHAFLHKRGKFRIIIIFSFFLLLLYQTIREFQSDSNEYLYIFLLLILIVFPPINLYTSYKGYFKKNWAFDPNVIYTMDRDNIKIKRKHSSDKKSSTQIAKITENKNALYLWWKDSFETTIIPKRCITNNEQDFIQSLSPKIS